MSFRRISFVLMTVFSLNVLAIEKNVKLIILVDRSSSMSPERSKISNVVDILTEKLEAHCSHYSIAVGELNYNDKSGLRGILLGDQDDPKNPQNPIFVTEKTEKGVELLASRIKDASDRGVCGSDCVMVRQRVGSEEVTYSSLVDVVENYKNEITETPLDFLATLVITNTAPIFESMKAQEALERISKIQPTDIYMSTDISYNNWDREYESCRLDMPRDFSIDDFSSYTLNSLRLFSELSGGQSFNICRPMDYDIQLEEFINLVLVRAGCFPMS